MFTLPHILSEKKTKKTPKNQNKTKKCYKFKQIIRENIYENRFFAVRDGTGIGDASHTTLGVLLRLRFMCMYINYLLGCEWTANTCICNYLFRIYRDDVLFYHIKVQSMLTNVIKNYSRYFVRSE